MANHISVVQIITEHLRLLTKRAEQDESARTVLQCMVSSVTDIAIRGIKTLLERKEFWLIADHESIKGFFLISPPKPFTLSA